MDKQNISTFACAVLFSDIAGSSLLFKSLGNDAAKAKIDAWINTMVSIVEQQGGCLVKTIGDEIMVYFEDVDSACTSAMALNLNAHEQGFRLKTGISLGQVIRDQGDLFGDTVNNAAFLTKAAHPEEILIDALSAHALSKWLKMHSDLFDHLLLKGQSDAVEILRLNWRAINGLPLDQTMVSDEAHPSMEIDQTLMLTCYGQSHTLSCRSPAFRIGRESRTNTLCVDQERASRSHCTIHFRRGKFVLEDHSTNGTYVLPAARNEVYIRRESTPLLSSGTFCLGQPHKRGEVKIAFEVHAKALQAQ